MSRLQAMTYEARLSKPAGLTLKLAVQLVQLVL